MKFLDQRSEYLKRIDGVRTSSQDTGRVESAFHALSAPEAERIKDRLGDFTTYGQPGDLELMDQLFKLGSQFRNRAMARVNVNDGDTRINESLVLKTLMEEMGPLENCRPLLDCIYDRKIVVTSAVITNGHLWMVTFKDGTSVLLNSAQSRAVHLYANKDGPRVFCVRSPPGSGKTMTAVTMATVVADSFAIHRDVQFLLSVQNVAVDNMGYLLKKIGFEGSEVYNMKSKTLNPHELAPYDFFDLMSEEKLERWRSGQVKLSQRQTTRNILKSGNTVDCITYYRKEFEKTVKPKIFLSTVEMVIHKMFKEKSKLQEVLSNVKRIIIDEASLLTEAALYAIIRRFPMAKIVLIGDEQQLPPFQFDSKILGQELAGRSALSVATKNKKMLVVELSEVYRAPPSLITPYNRLAYGGRLVSMKAEGETPLCDIGLIPHGKPQLLLIDVDGQQERNERTMSFYNRKEIRVLQSLLKKFPLGSMKDIMIICLYKEQKCRIDKILNGRQRRKKYNVLTVDSAQGKEAPIVIVMTTRTEKASDFFCCMNRCNVAVSRQQEALIILGKASLLTNNYPWSTVVSGFTSILPAQIM